MADVYAQVMPLLGIPTTDDTEAKSGLIDIISGIFQPVLGVMAASGMIKGFTVMFQTMGLYSADSGIYRILDGIGGALFMFLPIFLGFTAAQKFKVRPMVGLTLGTIFCYPTLQLSALSGGDATPVSTLFAGTPSPHRCSSTSWASPWCPSTTCPRWYRSSSSSTSPHGSNASWTG